MRPLKNDGTNSIVVSDYLVWGSRHKTRPHWTITVLEPVERMGEGGRGIRVTPILPRMNSPITLQWVVF